MSRSAGWDVRLGDMERLTRELNRVPGSHGDLYDAARVLVGWAELPETQQTQLPPVNVASLVLPLDEPVNVPADPDVEPQPYDMPSPEADALDRIADAIREWREGKSTDSPLGSVIDILDGTGRL